MIKPRIRCVREYKWPAILAPVCMVGEVYMETKIPLVLAKVVERLRAMSPVWNKKKEVC